MSSRIVLSLFICVGIFAYQEGFAQHPFNGNGGNGGVHPKVEDETPLAAPFGGSCIERNGRYSVAGQCDAYVECTDGVPSDKLCPDGLMFNDKVKLFVYPCQYPIDVDCGTRTALQPPNATAQCPHQFGYYKLGDANNCGKFMNCANGRAFTFECPEGLAFSEETYRCDWADEVKDCDAEKYLGFTCPTQPKIEGFGPSEIRFYTTPEDCRKYFVCLGGRPRMYNCGPGNGFNELTNGCDAAVNVTTCPEYGQYVDEPEEALEL